jgi:hypothetical protein
VERLWGFPLTRAEIGVLEWKETAWGADDRYSTNLSPILRLDG